MRTIEARDEHAERGERSAEQVAGSDAELQLRQIDDLRRELNEIRGKAGNRRSVELRYLAVRALGLKRGVRIVVSLARRTGRNDKADRLERAIDSLLREIESAQTGGG